MIRFRAMNHSHFLLVIYVTRFYREWNLLCEWHGYSLKNSQDNHKDLRQARLGIRKLAGHSQVYDEIRLVDTRLASGAN